MPTCSLRTSNSCCRARSHGPTSGRRGCDEGWSDWLTAWQDFRTEDIEILDGAAEGVYVVFVRLTARGKESSVPIDARGANVVVMRDHKIARFEIHWNRDEALAAAGL